MLTTVAPTSPLLKEYIDSFYFFSAAPADSFRYLAFPHTNTGLSFLRGVTITRANFEAKIVGGSGIKPEYCIEILGKYMQPVLVHYTGRVEEIAIVFKPLGINRFIDTDFLTAAPNFSQPFEERAWQDVAPALFASADPVKFLEEFLLAKMAEKNELRQLEGALALLEDKLSDYPVTAVAESTGLGFKTFQRHFTKALGCSPTDYKRIARFRNALNAKIHSKELKSLTSISYETNYSDQSHFIREFRKLTSQNPKLFFREVSLVDGEKIAWEIL